MACSKKVRILRTSSAPGSEAARDKWLVPKSRNFEKTFYPRQRSCRGQVVSSKKSMIFEKKFCPRQRRCPGQVACSQKNRFLRRSPAAGSEAARDKLPVQKKFRFLRKRSTPGSEAAGTPGFCSKSPFLEKVLPQAAKLPGTSGLFQKKSEF